MAVSMRRNSRVRHQTFTKCHIFYIGMRTQISSTILSPDRHEILEPHWCRHQGFCWCFGLVPTCGVFPTFLPSVLFSIVVVIGGFPLLCCLRRISLLNRFRCVLFAVLPSAFSVADLPGFQSMSLTISVNNLTPGFLMFHLLFLNLDPFHSYSQTQHKFHSRGIQWYCAIWIFHYMKKVELYVWTSRVLKKNGRIPQFKNPWSRNSRSACWPIL